MKTLNQSIQLPLLKELQVSLTIKREDLIHPTIRGNKFRKLKYNLIAAKKGGYDCLLTFGGAYSNHILATALAGKEQGLRTIGIIRGEELSALWEQNPTLTAAHKAGMEFRFVTREKYREKSSKTFISDLNDQYGNIYILPEGGTNDLAVKGCEEILTDDDAAFDYICCSVGTGGTLSGLIKAAHHHQRVIGFPALKGDFLQKDICKFVSKDNWELQTQYHFGGYARVSAELITFINNFKESTQIQLDPIYTGKMLYGIIDMIKKHCFKPQSSILAIHTGGIQGIAGMNTKMKSNNLPLIKI
ncbi:1-aminocyclopropane-1-carboxylate deaminase/D-cysteine desulfhydrase [Muriicola sp. Z0-33]|uniref:1-aminocyclopropane-1-carboxylate deaminase/D-cysteine desulfhydrase n=1 Tax=Muriicola sp. Z0-33 TaxID=2816957 RepID=UPI0022377A2F|nr:pyridoxal-phosphate dependent enzyme [Muriicola sp. Z0-33]MCW5517916.1 1-aminocyclopropane-1-carboxylate deaminase/D-cysteine desulfhydrase [Muriicola sp. Z0-33]